MADDAQRKLDEKAVYDREANLHRPIYSSYWDRDLYERMFRAEYDGDVQRLARELLPGKRVLILGAGPAEVRLVSAHTPCVEALNISKKAIAELNEMFPDVHAFVADAETFRAAQPYQVIYCHSVLHHLQPFERVVENIAQCLEPGGVLFAAAEPGLYNPFAALARRFAPSQSHTPGERPFRFSTFSRTLGRHFEPLFENSYFLASMLLPYAGRKLAPAKPLLGPLLDLTLNLERRLKKLPGARDLYWITCGVYRKR
jgi:SAM-dependent methyltransferase